MMVTGFRKVTNGGPKQKNSVGNGAETEVIALPLHGKNPTSEIDALITTTHPSYLKEI